MLEVRKSRYQSWMPANKHDIYILIRIGNAQVARGVGIISIVNLHTAWCRPWNPLYPMGTLSSSFSSISRENSEAAIKVHTRTYAYNMWMYE